MPFLQDLVSLGCVPEKERPNSLNTVSQAEAARILGVSHERVRQWIEDGRLNGRRVTGWARLRLLRADVESFKKDRERR